MKIYTRTGDDGTTGLFGGGRLRKSDLRIECYGTIDELNASLGLAAAGADDEMTSRLRAVQNDLFVIGAHMATADVGTHTARLPHLSDECVSRLEMQIDAADAQLPPLRAFILPGGTETAARLHVARTICRRAERLTVAFAMERPVAPLILAYLNRLGDWLFTHARWVNHRAGVSEILWEKPT